LDPREEDECSMLRQFVDPNGTITTLGWVILWVLQIAVVYVAVRLFWIYVKFFFRKRYEIYDRLRFVESWAEQNGQTVVWKTETICWPFWYLQSTAQVVYYVVLEDDVSRSIRRGWAKCGGYLISSWNPQVEFYPDTRKPQQDVLPP
jgi:hypothetical protein